MRYIKTSIGTLVAPRKHMGHQQMLRAATYPKGIFLLSAGFLTALNSRVDIWRCTGESVGLGIVAEVGHEPDPAQLWVGELSSKFGAKLLFSDNPELLQNCDNIQAAQLAFTNEYSGDNCSGEVPVLAPKHPDYSLSRDELFGWW